MNYFILLAAALLVVSVTPKYSGSDPECGGKHPEAVCCDGDETPSGFPDEVTVLDCEKFKNNLFKCMPGGIYCCGRFHPEGNAETGPGLECKNVQSPEGSTERDREPERCPVPQGRRKRYRGDEIAAGQCHSDTSSNSNQAVATTYGTETGIGTDTTDMDTDAEGTIPATNSDTTVFSLGTDTKIPETANAIDESQTNDYVATPAVVGQIWTS